MNLGLTQAETNDRQIPFITKLFTTAFCKCATNLLNLSILRSGEWWSGITGAEFRAGRGFQNPGSPVPFPATESFAVIGIAGRCRWWRLAGIIRGRGSSRRRSTAGVAARVAVSTRITWRSATTSGRSAAAAAASKDPPEGAVACDEDTEFIRPELTVDFSACVADMVRK